LRYGHEVGRVEELPDGNLVGDRPAPRLTERARQHRLFFVVQPH